MAGRTVEVIAEVGIDESPDHNGRRSRRRIRSLAEGNAACNYCGEEHHTDCIEHATHFHLLHISFELAGILAGIPLPGIVNRPCII